MLQESRNAICIEGAISSSDGTEDFVIFPEYTDMLCGLKKTYNENIQNIIEGKIAQNNHSSKTISILLKMYLIYWMKIKNWPRKWRN